MREPRGVLVSLSVNASVRGRKIVSVIDWLLDSDPAIRWQAMRDLTDAPADQVAAERARVASEGWGARLLTLRREDGLWDTGTPQTEEITLLALLLLRDMGLDPSSEEARNAIGLIRDNATWHSRGPWHGTPLFAGEVEPCINGRVVTVGSYFGQDVTGIVERLLGEQTAGRFTGSLCAPQFRNSSLPTLPTSAAPAAVPTRKRGSSATTSARPVRSIVPV